MVIGAGHFIFSLHIATFSVIRARVFEVYEVSIKFIVLSFLVGVCMKFFGWLKNIFRKKVVEQKQVVTEVVEEKKPIFYVPEVFEVRRNLFARIHNEIGVHEEGGNNKGKRVAEYQKTVDGKAQGESWCMAFVQFIVKGLCEDFKLDYEEFNEFLYQSEHCLTVWNKTHYLKDTIENAFMGDIIIWQKNGTTNGHTGFIIDSFKYITAEGNTSDKSQDDGDCVTYKTRPKFEMKGFTVLGVINICELIRAACQQKRDGHVQLDFSLL